MKSLSVVVPLYNKGGYIERCLNSVLEQNVRPAEIIVIDDGSTDGGGELVEAKYPEVRLIRQRNAGVSVARNRGIELANSEFVAFLDADDFWESSFLCCIRDLLEEFPNAGAYCTHYGFIDEVGARAPAYVRRMPEGKGLIADYFASCYNADLPITASSVCIRRSLLLEIGGFPVGMEMGEDQAVWARLACHVPIAYHSQTCVYYDRSVANSACHTHLITEPAPQLKIYQELFDSLTVPPELSTSLRRLIHLSVMSCVKNNLILGRRRQAAELLNYHPGLCWDFYRFAGYLCVIVPTSFVVRLFYWVRRTR